jgi:hypothetical protein
MSYFDEDGPEERRESANESGMTKATPAMNEAGKMALVKHDPEHYSLEIVESHWRAMSAAKS